MTSLFYATQEEAFTTIAASLFEQRPAAASRDVGMRPRGPARTGDRQEPI